MPLQYVTKTRAASLAAALCLFVCALAHGQQQQQQQQSPRPAREDDVIRITSELVQTDVAVFDKRGRFVDDLRPEQFELQVDGKTQPVIFFERVTAGGRDEASQLAAAARGRGADRKSVETNTAAAAEQPERGRLIFFFL